MKSYKSITNRIILLIVVATLIPVILLGVKLVDIAGSAIAGESPEVQRAVISEMQTNIGIYSIYAVFIAFILGLFFAGSIIRPLRELSEAARRISQGDFDVSLPKATTEDELGVLTRSFGEMARELDRSYSYITETRDYLQNIIKSSADAIVTADMEGIIQEWNKGAEEIFGYRAGEIIGKNVLEIYPQNRRLERARWLEELKNGGTISNKKVQIITKDGSIIEVLLSLSLLRDENDQPIGTVGVSKDITKLIELENALKASEERYRTLVETMNEGIWVADKEGRAVFCNQRFYDMVRYPPEDVIGKSITEFMDDENVEISARELEKWKAGEHTSFETEFTTRDGTRLQVIISGSPLKDVDGSVSGSFAVISDISARKRAEQELVMTTTQLATIYNSSPVGITLVDRDFRVKSLNRAMEKLTGCSRLDAIDRFCYEYFGSSAVCDGCPVVKVFETGEVQKNLRTSGGDLGGNLVLEQIAAPVLDSDGIVISAIEITRDITKEKELERELRHSYQELQATYTELKELDRLKDEFFSSVSHELKTPLTSIYGSVDLMYTLGNLTPEQEEFVRLIEKSTTRLNLLIDDLLQLARGDRLMKVQNIEEFSLPELLEESIGEFESLLKKYGIDMKLEAGEGLPPITGDREQIKKVLTNLINNAIKFNVKRGKILIEAINNNGEIEVSVEDTGIGIPKEDQENIFKRFYRVERGEAKRYPGTGIGLSLVKTIVESHGGMIWVESTPGKGSKFTFTLPTRGDFDERRKAKWAAKKG
jgi:PAS domain S-box-containing protein